MASDQVMEHPRIDDEKVLDRYLVGELSPAEEELFEEHLFACADCLEQVQAGEELRRGLRAVAAEDAARAAVSAGVVAWLKNRRGGRLAGLLGLALSLAVVFVVLPAALLRQQAELERLRAAAASSPRVDSPSPDSSSPDSPKLEPMADLAVIPLGTVRGGEPVEIRPDPEKRAFLLSLELPTSRASRYRVTLRDATGEELWRGDDLEPTLYDTLIVVLPAGYLAPGRYRIEIEALEPSGAEPAGEIELRLLPGG